MADVKFTHIYLREHHIGTRYTVEFQCIVLKTKGKLVQIKYQDQEGNLAVKWVSPSKVRPI
jgi:hypothetical protein